MSVAGSNERLAIAMIAIDARPWSRVMSELFRDDVRRCGATFILQAEGPSGEWADRTDATPRRSDDDDTYIYIHNVIGAFKRRDVSIPSLVG